MICHEFLPMGPCADRVITDISLCNDSWYSRILLYNALLQDLNKHVILLNKFINYFNVKDLIVLLKYIYMLTQITVILNSSHKGMIDRRAQILIGQHLPPI